MTEAIAVLGMFASILAILRWFKQDTAEMIKIYAESTEKRIQSMEKNIDAIREEMKDFHNRLCAIEERRKSGE